MSFLAKMLYIQSFTELKIRKNSLHLSIAHEKNTTPHILESIKGIQQTSFIGHSGSESAWYIVTKMKAY